MPYPLTQSSLTPEINSNLSPSFLIKVGQVTVGALQNLTINQRRDIHVWEEIGTDGIVDSHPKGAAKIRLTVNRVVFDNLRLTEAFGRGFINIQAQRLPFNIQALDRSAAENENDELLHVFHNCWFNEYSPTVRAESFLINEQASLTCERITSSVNALNASNGGLRGIAIDYDTIERSTDLNGRPGRFDATRFLVR